MKMFFLVLCLGLPSCAVFERISFGLDVANAESSVSISVGSGKSVLQAERGAERLRTRFSTIRRAE